MEKKSYDHKKIEKKAQEKWEKLDLHTTDLSNTIKDPYYLLVEFPYPSGDLHVGHWYAFAVTDIYARYMRMKGKNVLFPFGFDAFGLPAENAAIKNGKDPIKWTYENMDSMRRQVRLMGTSFDWSREVVTCEPEYYKWTQWLFSKLYEHELAYRAEASVKWCPKDQTVLANEQVHDGMCERCGTVVEEKRLTQWFFAITKYADRLINDLDGLAWGQDIKDAQRAWIGKSEGAEISFTLTSPRNYILLHGFTGTPSDNFFPWCKDQLEKEGHVVTVPVLPHTDTPTEEEWVNSACTATRYNENTILFGHSLGAVTALKVLERLKTPIKKVIFAGGFIDPSFAGHPRNFEKTFTWDFDWERIRSNAFEFIVLHDAKDSAVSLDQSKRLAKALGVDVTVVSAEEDHFCAEKEPEILKALMATSDLAVKVFTTRADTIYGATYLVIAPENILILNLLKNSRIENAQEVTDYIQKTSQKTERERSENKEKTGVELKGLFAINPANKEPIPVYIADYVLSSYGTGAVMAVPAHDERDFEFAKKYNLPIKQVVLPSLVDERNPHVEGKEYTQRDVIIGVVYDPKKDAYLCLKWKEKPWTTFITGGVEEGEDAVEAAQREIIEETGYNDLRFIRTLGGMCESKFFAAHKDVNRTVRSQGVLFELVSEGRQEVSEEEKAMHETLWIPSQEVVGAKLQHAEFDLLWQRIQTGVDTYTGNGLLIDSEIFSGRGNREAMTEIITVCGGESLTKYRLRDWGVSRQRYWGCPIPVVYDPEGKAHLVPSEHLPWLLPTDVDFTPNGKGSPLTSSQELKERVTRLFGEGWTPEYDTLDTFVDSSWYYTRYLTPNDAEKFSDLSLMQSWLPVDRYSGGSEHTTMHLLYARFFYKALYDLALVPTSEPFLERYNRGLILGTDGQKMSKRWGNVINPDEVVEKVGADALRVYLAFIGPYNEVGSYPWKPEGVEAMRRFLDRVYALKEKITDSEPSEEVLRAVMRATVKVDTDSTRFKFNTALSALMILLNELQKETDIARSTYHDYLRLLAPFAPHLCEHLFESTEGKESKESIHQESFPVVDETLLESELVVIPIQIGGKRRGEVIVTPSATEEEVLALALVLPAVEKVLNGAKPHKTIYIQGKILNLVV
jgi:leucyl-tRNA synthetase